jgi:hypothetical protein
MNQLAEIRDTVGRSESDEGTDDNPFWRNIRRFAAQACQNRTNTAQLNVMGVCTVRSFADESGNYSRNVEQTIQQGQPGYRACVRARRAEIIARRDARIAEVTADDFEQPRPGRPITARGVRRAFQTQIDAVEATSRIHGCRQPGSETIRDAARNPVRGTLEIDSVIGIADKMRQGQTLSPDEENRIRAAFGVSSGHFSNIFCRSNDHERFRENLNFHLSNAQAPGISGSGSVADLYKGQATLARNRLQQCYSNLRNNTGEDGANCRLVDTTPEALECVNERFPLLVVDRSSGRCQGVNQYSDVNGRVTLGTFGAGGAEGSLNFGSARTFGSNYVVQEYRCAGDRPLSNRGGGRCWWTPSANDPARAGEAEALEYLRNRGIRPGESSDTEM